LPVKLIVWAQTAIRSATMWSCQ